jgi:hypothetical protein
MISLNIFLFLESRVKIGIEHKFIKLTKYVLSRLYNIDSLVRLNINKVRT